MTVTTYTKTSSISADRDSIEIFWGDATSQIVKRTNGNGQQLPNDVKVNKYVAEHTYPGRATYTMGFADPNRVANILNVNYPNSVDVEFFLSTTFTLLDPQFQGTNSSAILLQPPVDIACVNKQYIHNPNAYDPDGDSLSYELVIPRMSAMEEVPGYLFPDEVSPGGTNNVYLNPTTGNFVWNTPKQQGEYNIAIKINEWRNGILLNSIIRDMQILVLDCNNRPPVIEVENEICVVAGEEINLELKINDPDDNQLVLLTALGGPFEVENDKARLENNPGQAAAPFTSNFVWQTTCNHISDQYYQVVFRAIDNFFGDTTGLATLRTIRIKVVGSPPQNLTAETENNGIRLFWEKPYDCEITNDEYFQGFSVWRKTGSTSMQLDTCNPGMKGSPYTKVIFLTNDIIGDSYTSIDNSVEKGITYCYRVIAEFAKLSATGNPYNRVESLRSNEVCLQLIRDLPIITKVSIDKTENNGSVHIRWSKPFANDLDTITNPPPYKYELFRSIDDGLSYNIVQDFTITTPHYSTQIDTNYIDLGLNTINVQPQYYIKFHSNQAHFGNSAEVSSTFLEISSSDLMQTLNWSSFVPWSKTYYNIHLYNQVTSSFDFLSTTNVPSFTHNNLDNGVEYCYKIEAFGSYSIPNIEDPLINYSQEVCSVPMDNIPPCPPVLKVTNICDSNSEINSVEDLINTLTFTQPNVACIETNDVLGYYIYFSILLGDTLTIIDSILEATTNVYLHNPNIGISGCYAISAFDSNYNESARSNVVCVDNCPEYKLPNTFTPNNDGSNELFVPIINRFIASIDFVVYNEWGNQVFSTKNSKIEWDGVSYNGKPLAEGTYYYKCKVFEQRVIGIVEAKEILKGYIHIIK